MKKAEKEDTKKERRRRKKRRRLRNGMVISLKAKRIKSAKLARNIRVQSISVGQSNLRKIAQV